MIHLCEAKNKLYCFPKKEQTPSGVKTGVELLGGQTGEAAPPAESFAPTYMGVSKSRAFSMGDVTRHTVEDQTSLIVSLSSVHYSVRDDPCF